MLDLKPHTPNPDQVFLGPHSLSIKSGDSWAIFPKHQNLNPHQMFVGKALLPGGMP
jgi:hypothetical protein